MATKWKLKMLRGKKEAEIGGEFPVPVGIHLPESLKGDFSGISGCEIIERRRPTKARVRPGGDERI